MRTWLTNADYIARLEADVVEWEKYETRVKTALSRFFDPRDAFDEEELREVAVALGVDNAR